MAKYGLPIKELERIRERDKFCVYCHKTMIQSGNIGGHGDWVSIEHLNRFPPWNNPTTVVLCCISCNSSRGQKKLRDWFKTPYCIERNINEDTVAEPVKIYLSKNESRI